MLLNQEVFASIVHNTPLISIDLIVENSKGQILLGKRINEPAKDFWFVPGGRIFKDETLDAAFERTTKEEIGLDIKREDATFIDVYEHFYNNNVFDNQFSTHYVVLAHKITTDEELVLNEQHEKYEWFDKKRLLESVDVHKYTKDYFKGNR